MKAPSDLGNDLVADEGVVVGYPSGRGRSGKLVLGRSARLRSGTVLYQGTRIGDNFETGHHVIVREDSTIGDDVSIWSNSVVDYGCVIGSRVKIHSNCYIAQFTEIEDDVFIAPGVVVANDLYPGRADSASLMSGPTIRSGAQVGANSTLLPYVTVGAGALVGAGSVVTRDIPDGMVAYGCPAVPMRTVNSLGPVLGAIELVAGAARRYRRRGGA